MLAQFLLNLVIAFLWVFLNDETTFEIPTFIAGYLIGIVVIFLLHRFFETPFYLKRVISIIKLMGIFNYELITSSFLIMKQIIVPKGRINPGTFEYKTRLENDWQITSLVLLLMLTPGSAILRVGQDNQTFTIHTMDLHVNKPMVIKSIKIYENMILEVTRP
ncbi:Na+/H+ antiporter subunit E [Jeotgalibacillus malaysiensis]|uniref:Na+/H+ antiporter subunit E n=1 Tax=Jeotgalibacillus malaysiensis TaxID=1508404 RepID=UPI00384FEF6A